MTQHEITGTAAALAAQHQHLVADLVRQVLARVPSHVDRHALRAAADAAFLEATRTFDDSRGVRFADHATAWIRLALRDLLRSLPLRAPDSPASPASGPDRLSALETAITALPAAHRLAVTSYFLEAQPVADIATELGIPASRVEVLVADTLVLLRDALNGAVVPASTTRPAGRRPRRPRVTRRTTSARFEYLTRGPRLILA